MVIRVFTETKRSYIEFRSVFQIFKTHLTLSCRRPWSYRNQSIDMHCKSMDWFLYNNGPRHERVKHSKTIYITFMQLLMFASKFPDFRQKLHPLIMQKSAKVWMLKIFWLSQQSCSLKLIIPSTFWKLGHSKPSWEFNNYLEDSLFDFQRREVPGSLSLNCYW